MTITLERPTLSYRDAFSSIGDRYPETPWRAGPWEVRKFTVSEQEAKFAALRASFSFSSRGRFVPAGEYVGLWHDKRGVVMSATPDEMRDHSEPYYQAQRAGESAFVLLAGFGLGMVAHGVLQLPNVAQVNVIEIDHDVILLAEAAFAPEIASKRLTIHQGDALTYTWLRGMKWSVAWYDIWDNICSDNASEMTTLKRRYARRVRWQGCWAEHLTRRDY